MERHSWMKIEDVMTKNPLVMTPAETIGQASELMAENSIRQLPVVEDGALLGIITDRDIRSSLSNRPFLSRRNGRERSKPRSEI